MAEAQKPEAPLSRKARVDLEDIWQFTRNQWSAAQADAYTSGILDACQLIDVMPYLNRVRPELGTDVRVHRPGHT